MQKAITVKKQIDRDSPEHAYAQLANIVLQSGGNGGSFQVTSDIKLSGFF